MKIICLFLAVLILLTVCSISVLAASGGYSQIAVLRLLIVEASLVMEHGL